MSNWSGAGLTASSGRQETGGLRTPDWVHMQLPLDMRIFDRAVCVDGVHETSAAVVQCLHPILDLI